MFKQTVSFIRDVYNIKDGIIPLHAPVFLGNEKKYINECIDSTFVSSVGKFVNLFEDKIAAYTGAKCAVAAVNGTAALHIALILSEVNQDDLVLTQPLTFVATANAIRYCGADPLFIDVEEETLGLSPLALKSFLKDNTKLKDNICYHKKTGRKIKACVPMHTFGHPCKIDEISEICNEFNIDLIEDAAESLGSFYKGKHTGTYGLMGILSFNGNKIITTGGGGIILTDNEMLARKAKHLTTTAKVDHSWEYFHDQIGYNYRLTNLAAALGVAQLEYIDEIIKGKRELSEKYKNFFESMNVEFIREPSNSKSNYWLNAIKLIDKNERDEFLKYTNEQGVSTRPIWRLMNNLRGFKDSIKDDLRMASFLEDRIVNIPSSYINEK